MCTHLSQLEKAGVPILESIQDLRDSVENRGLQDILVDVFDDMKNGKMLSEALAKHNKIFDTVFVGLIKAGEKTGQLSAVLDHLSHHLKWKAELISKVKKAIYYPIFLLFTMVIAITIHYDRNSRKEY